MQKKSMFSHLERSIKHCDHRGYEEAHESTKISIDRGRASVTKNGAETKQLGKVWKLGSSNAKNDLKQAVLSKLFLDEKAFDRFLDDLHI